MTDKLLCPFCQQELKLDSWNEVYMCRNPNCKHLLGFGTKELWQELITTRKALDLAIIELKNVVKDDDFDIYMRQLSAQTTLEQIESITKGNK